MSQDVARTEERSFERVIPNADVVVREDGWHIVLDMPGVSKDELVIDLQDRDLRVQGKSSCGDCGERSCLRHEFAPVEYVRSFSLSDEIDRAKITANFENGVLDVHLPEAESARPRKIEIQTA